MQKGCLEHARVDCFGKTETHEAVAATVSNLDVSPVHGLSNNIEREVSQGGVLPSNIDPLNAELLRLSCFAVLRALQPRCVH